MNIYEILELAINVISIGLKHDALLAKLDEAKRSGVPESDVPALLVKWRDEEVNKAAAATPDEAA